jgi:branched-subunit amino acid aminotransferase/4-amino-4-deoxychorismate lyase
MHALKASFPAYEFLRRLTSSYSQRGPPPEKIYEDPRNEHLLVWIGAPNRGRLIPRDLAGVSPWDASVQGGDACWEGIRVYRGKILSLERHLGRLFRSSKALGFKNVHKKEEIIEAIFKTLAVNGMRDNAHMRLTLTRGEKCTSSMNPNFNVYGTTLIILAEWKPTEVSTRNYVTARRIHTIELNHFCNLGRHNVRQYKRDHPHHGKPTAEPSRHLRFQNCEFSNPSD